MYKVARILIFLSVILVLPTLQVSAALLQCRTDPIFKLSNGDSITVTLNIATDEANIKNVSYALHVPAGVTVTRVTYTASGIGTKEMYKVYQDGPAKTYTTDTVVTTQQTGSVTVLATTCLNSISCKSISGYNGSHLVVTITTP